MWNSVTFPLSCTYNLYNSLASKRMFVQPKNREIASVQQLFHEHKWFKNSPVFRWSQRQSVAITCTNWPEDSKKHWEFCLTRWHSPDNNKKEKPLRCTFKRSGYEGHPGSEQSFDTVRLNHHHSTAATRLRLLEMLKHIWDPWRRQSALKLSYRRIQTSTGGISNSESRGGVCDYLDILREGSIGLLHHHRRRRCCLPGAVKRFLFQ